MGRLQSIRAQDKGEQTHENTHDDENMRPHTVVRSASCVRSVLYEICRPDNKPLTLMLPVNTSVQDVMSAVVKPGGDHILVKMNSTGGGSADVCVQIFFISFFGSASFSNLIFSTVLRQFVMLKISF